MACLYIRNIHNIISILFPVYILRTPFSFQNTDAVKKSFMVFCICTMEHLLWNATDFSFTHPEIHTSKTPLLSTFSKLYCTPTCEASATKYKTQLYCGTPTSMCAASATKYKTQLYCAQHQQQNSVFAPPSKHVVIMIKVSTMVTTKVRFDLNVLLSRFPSVFSHPRFTPVLRNLWYRFWDKGLLPFLSTGKHGGRFGVLLFSHDTA